MSVGSQSARTVWIEITDNGATWNTKTGHSLRGLCGLKSLVCTTGREAARRHSLRGLCGLKLERLAAVEEGQQSQSARTVWIEIYLA